MINHAAARRIPKTPMAIKTAPTGMVSAPYLRNAARKMSVPVSKLTKSRFAPSRLWLTLSASSAWSL